MTGAAAKTNAQLAGTADGSTGGAGSKSTVRRPWRDNIEAVTMAVVMAVMLKYFVVEAYKIPTGSMQPTLMGNKQLDLEDRILVDKLSFHFRDPERFEVVIFKYPLDRSKNFIKRIIGMPNEELEIRGGDLWVRPDGVEEWSILRKPAKVQESMWKPLLSDDPRRPKWRPNSAATSWQVTAHEIEARGDGAVRYPNEGSVVDNYRDGYPGKIGEKMGARPGFGNSDDNRVGDLRVRGTVAPLPGTREVVVEIHEGDLRYRLSLPGPAAAEGALAEIEARQFEVDSATDGGRVVIAPVFARSDSPRRLDAGKAVRFAAQSLDDLLELSVDGEVWVSLEIQPAEGDSYVQLGVVGEGADFEDLQVDRDIYYTTARVKMTHWDIPDASYVMLGDNTQDSSDSREWILERYELGPEHLGGERVEGDAKIELRGNYRGNNENPQYVAGAPGGPQVWFRDEWGELYHWTSDPELRLDPVDAPFVPRNLITGRALLVFWPVRRDLDVVRLKWIH